MSRRVAGFATLMAELPDPKSLLLEKLAVPCIDVSDDRRTAEDLLTIVTDEIPDLVVEQAKSKRLSIVVRSLNRLLRDPTDQEFGRRALRHLGFLDD
jgi:hypothetical protein